MTQTDGQVESSGGRNTVTLGAGEAIARLVAFAASLLVARRLGPEAFGVVGVASGLMLYLVQLADQGIELVGMPLVAREERDSRDIVSATLLFRTVGAVLLATVVAIVSRTLLPMPDGAVLAAYAPVLVLTGLSTRWVLLGLRRPGVVVGGRIAGELLAFGVVAVAVQNPADLTWVPLAAVVGVVMTTLVMLAGTWRAGIHLVLRLNWRECSALFARGRPMVAFTLLGLLLFNFDLIFLRIVKGEAAAGEYAAAYAFVSFASNLIVAFAHAVMPNLARSRDVSRGGERDRIYDNAMAQAIGVTLPVALGGAFVATTLLALVFGDRFTPGAIALRLLVLSLPFAALREVAVVGAIAAGGERALVRVNLITVGCNVVLCVVLVPAYGLAGAAAATLGTEAVRLLLAALAAAKNGYHAPPLGRYAKPAIASVIMGVGLYLAGPSPVVRAVAVGAVTYVGALTLLGGIRFHRAALPELTL